MRHGTRTRGDGTADLLGRSHIVIADDDTEMREMISDAMQTLGHHVIAFHDGREVFDYIVALVAGTIPMAPSLIVSDIRMPGLTGLEVLSALRNARLSIPVILMTGFGDPDTRARAAALGAVAVLDKPFPMERLQTAVAGLARPPKAT